MNGLKGVLIEWDALEERWQARTHVWVCCLGSLGNQTEVLLPTHCTGAGRDRPCGYFRCSSTAQRLRHRRIVAFLFLFVFLQREGVLRCFGRSCRECTRMSGRTTLSLSREAGRAELKLGERQGIGFLLVVHSSPCDSHSRKLNQEAAVVSWKARLRACTPSRAWEWHQHITNGRCEIG